MKQCKDCKHYRPETGFDDPTGEFAQCAAPKDRWKFVDHNREDRFPLDILMCSCGRRARWFEPKPAEAATPLPTITGLAAMLNPQVPPKRMPVPPSRAVGAASVPRRSPVSAAGPSASRSSTTDDGMSMLPAAMLLSSHSDDGSAADSGSFGSNWSAPVGRGGSFDGGGASGSWDSGSSSSSDSGSSSDGGSSSSSSD
ncbi:hypothetical protein RA280_19695 [Cupriavidus sp. CV2]|uniref:hypothetical protein n=1 Tax=Cupriavidus ulmosensis TaxID=3065913 RepID=UPI00296B12C0|nr:hypothetical protein [Cupriavidus sp. CV2]MDW3683927.1 hypothetical protein [Cupriavidus sp. CV2]